MTMNETSQKLHREIMAELAKDIHPNPGLSAGPNELSSLQNQFTSIVKDKYQHCDKEVLRRVEGELFAAGPIQPLIDDATVTEILINGPNEIWFERAGQLHKHTDGFYSQLSYQSFLQRMSDEAGIEANVERPAADGRWSQFRLHLIIPPVAGKNAHLSLRRQSHTPWTLTGLERLGWATPNAIEALRKLIRDRRSFLIVGGTSSGKTSVLNACLNEVDHDERIVTIEDTSEVRLPNSVSVGLLTRRDVNGILPQFDQSDLLKQALRMRPDRIVVGEVRGAEAKDLLMALSTGHEGGMGTLHADSARQAILRLEMLVQLGAPQWSVRAIRHLILLGIHAIVVVKKDKYGRRLDSITRITSLEETGFCFEPVI